MSEPSDPQKFEQLIVFVIYSPIEAHCFMMEMARLLDGVVPSPDLIELVAHILLGDANEVFWLFVAFMIMCGPWVFRFPPSTDRRLWLVGEKLMSGPTCPDGGVEFDCERDAVALVSNSVQAPVEAPGEPIDLAPLNAQRKQTYKDLFGEPRTGDLAVVAFDEIF
jgi:hypothetical protein